MNLKDLSVDEVNRAVESHEFTGSYELTWGVNKGKTHHWDRTGDWHYIMGESREGFKIPHLGIVKLVDEYGGEGQGDEYYFVFSVTDGDVTRFFKRHGYHVSHDGSYLEGPTTERTPVEKTVIVWQSV